MASTVSYKSTAVQAPRRQVQMNNPMITEELTTASRNLGKISLDLLTKMVAVTAGRTQLPVSSILLCRVSSAVDARGPFKET
ncbi:hypothetical protein TWF481_010698 [Arthrobotrys musiformis]|uniref:Uncharacterized protein n=1 Tax=Arthrobotrys musiformis TaxID=47236 RepID=A0AAV9W3E0_9PEZI